MNLVNLYRVEIEAVDEYGQLLHTDALFGLAFILHLTQLIVDIARILPDRNERQ